MEGLKKLYNWLCNQIINQTIPQEERIVYSKVLDYIEQNIKLEEYI